MLQTVRKEEVVYCDKIPALIKYQRLTGLECCVPLHWHREIELNLMLEGTGEFLVNGVRNRLTPGSVNLINSEDIHMGEPPTTVPVTERKVELITILWDYDFLLHYASNLASLRFELNRCPENIRREISSMMRRIGLLHLERAFCAEMDITALLLQIGSRLMKYCVAPQESTEMRVNSRLISDMRTAANFIEEHYADDLTMEFLAAQYGFSNAYFSKKFKRMTGVTFKDFLGKCRMKHAVQELLNTDMTINEIAYKNGFPNVKSYIELFKRLYGMTPQKYREMT